MGNVLGNINQQNEEVLSSTIPYLKRMEADAKNLVLNINPSPPMGEENIFTETENYELYKIFEKNLNVGHNQDMNDFSETSPFISSEKYNNLMKNQRGGGDEEDDSSTSSSDNEMSDDNTPEDVEDLVNKNMSSEDMSSENTDSEEMVLTDTMVEPKKICLQKICHQKNLKMKLRMKNQNLKKNLMQ